MCPYAVRRQARNRNHTPRRFRWHIFAPCTSLSLPVVAVVHRPYQVNLTLPYHTKPAKVNSFLNMVNIRQATVNDLLQMQTTNLWCLPENYQVSAPCFPMHPFPTLQPLITGDCCCADEVLLLSLVELAAASLGS